MATIINVLIDKLDNIVVSCRELYCWTDRWYDMTIEDIKKMEKEAVEELKKQIAEPEKRGTVCDVGDKRTS